MAGGGALPAEVAKGGFELRRVTAALESSLVPSPSSGVVLRHWTRAYWELNALFPQLGYLWSFVEADIRAKLTTVEEATGALAADVDVVSALLSGPNVSSPSAACVAFLRLHRAMEFIVRVVSDVFAAPVDAPLGPVARRAYDETLGRYNGWAARTLVHAAMLGLGRRRDLQAVLIGHLSEAQALPFVRRLAAAAQQLHRRLQPSIDNEPALRSAYVS